MLIRGFSGHDDFVSVIQMHQLYDAVMMKIRFE